MVSSKRSINFYIIFADVLREDLMIKPNRNLENYNLRDINATGTELLNRATKSKHLKTPLYL